jgi:hypothetical protein
MFRFELCFDFKGSEKSYLVLWSPYRPLGFAFGSCEGCTKGEKNAKKFHFTGQGHFSDHSQLKKRQRLPGSIKGFGDNLIAFHKELLCSLSSCAEFFNRNRNYLSLNSEFEQQGKGEKQVWWTIKRSIVFRCALIKSIIIS